MSAFDDDERWEAEAQVQAEAYQDAIIEEALKGISQEAISSYLCKFGDAIDERIGDLHATAGLMHNIQQYGLSLTCSCTAIEVTIRDFLLSPLVQGAFLYEEWSKVLAARIVSGRAADERTLLPSIVEFFGVDIKQARLSTGEAAWQFLHDTVWQARNKYAHRGDPVSQELARKAMECAVLLRDLAEKVIRQAGCIPLLDAENRKKFGWVGKWSPSGSSNSPFR
jgi:hypothetical protein